MKKGSCSIKYSSLIVAVMLILIIGLVSFPVSAQIYGDNDSSVENETDKDDENETEKEIEIEEEDGESRIEIRSERRYDNGTRIRERLEIRERINITDSERGQILRAEKRLRIESDSDDSDVPENCERHGVVLRCEIEDGTREMTVHASSGNRIVIQSGGANATTNVTLYHHNGSIFGDFGENDTRRVILPDEARTRIREKVRSRLENETINLTESGEYLIEARKRARLFGIFEVKEKISANIDAETGEVLKTKNPWWGFLARDITDEEQEQEEPEESSDSNEE
ncbi:MAG: hypothetical protein WDZ69_00540 [Candidatus Pacearchaeota archaeon]